MEIGNLQSINFWVGLLGTNRRVSDYFIGSWQALVATLKEGLSELENGSICRWANIFDVNLHFSLIPSLCGITAREAKQLS